MQRADETLGEHDGLAAASTAVATSAVSVTPRRTATAVAVAPGVWVYQMSGDRLALEITAKGTKYYKDSDLN